jgi:hypothetical protein
MIVCTDVACCSNISCGSLGRNWGLKIPSPSQQVRHLTWRCTLPFRRPLKTKVHIPWWYEQAQETRWYTPEKRRRFTAIVVCLQSNNTAFKYYDIHCTMLFNRLNICILTLPLHICGVDRRYFISLFCVSPWGKPKKTETCSRFTACFYISVHIRNAVAGVCFDCSL